MPSERLNLKSKSSEGWLHCVLNDFDSFLIDHAACERKASATCLSFVVKYRDKIDLVTQMIEVAREELDHFQQVCALVHSRNLVLGEDSKDAYVHQFLSLARESPQDRLCDRLLMSGIMESRGGERFGQISEAIEDPFLKDFYWKLSRAEAKHQLFFVHLAEQYFPTDKVAERLEELLIEEARILEKIPLRSALH